MNNFDFENSIFFKKSKWKIDPFFSSCRFLRCLFLVILSLFFILFLLGFFSGDLEEVSLSRILGVCILTLTLSVYFFLLELFSNSEEQMDEKDKIEDAFKKPENYNLASLLSFKSSKSIFNSIKWAKAHKISQVDSNLFLYLLLKENPELDFVFHRILVNPRSVKKALLKELKNKSFNNKEHIPGETSSINYSEDFYKSLLGALERAFKRKHGNIEVGDLLFGLSKENYFLKKTLSENKVKPKDVDEIIYWLEFFGKEEKERKKWWEHNNLIRKRTIGKQFSSGYSITLDKYSVDISDVLRKRNFRPFFGHKSELRMVERILSRKGINNVLLIGQVGSGRKTIISQFAQKSFFGNSAPNLNYNRIVKLDFSALTSYIQDVEELEFILDEIFKETVRAGNIILVIDDIHNYVGGEIKPGVFDISGIIAPYLHMPSFRVIATTSYFGLYDSLEKKSAFSNLFEKVRISEISPEETITVLEDMVPYLEKRYGVFISYLALRDIVKYTEQYLPALSFPKKAQDILDESLIMLRRSSNKILTPEYVSKIVSEKSRIPIGEIKDEERKLLLNLENLIHQRVIGQKHAVDGVSSALRRARSEIKIKKGPMGSFLFLGPTGVGKTETAKTLAEIYFGSEEKMIRLDMSEFQQVKDISRLIGSNEQKGILTSKVKENPFSLILLDEIEKAHPDILNIFLQILDEGYVTDGFGRKVNFKNSIIIATSNAGYKMILEYIGKNSDWVSVKKNLLSYLFSEGSFRPEFINRFDGVVVFKPLNHDDLMNVCQLQLNKLKERLFEKDVEFVVTEGLKGRVVDLSYNPQFGAREMQRVIQDKIENPLAKAILSGSLKKGNKVEIEPKNFNLIIS